MQSKARGLVRKGILWCVAILAVGLLCSCSKPPKAPPPPSNDLELLAPQKEKAPTPVPTEKVSAPKEKTPDAKTKNVR